MGAVYDNHAQHRSTTRNVMPALRTARYLLVPGLLVGAVILAGCGSGEEAQQTASTSTSASTTTSTTEPGAQTNPMGGGMSADAPAADFPNVAYADSSSSQVLDLWLPADTTEPAPLVVYVHGGAFKVGDKSMVGGKVQSLLDAGYAVASVNYRLSGEALFPAGAQDVKAAVRFLRANADEYDIDPNKFAAWGESAGGNLVALLGTTGDQTTELDDPALGNPTTSSAVQAVVDWYGPSDFLQMDTQAASGESECANPQTHDPASSPESAWIGAALQSAPDTVEQANPISYIESAGDLPPFSIAAGTADCNVPYQQSEILADALSAAGGQVDITIEPGWTHADARFDSELLATTIDWLTTTLGN